MARLWSALAVLLLSSGALAEDALPPEGQDLIFKQVGETPTSSPVSYQCKFINNWTAANHPQNYPSNAAHWSPPTFAAHSPDYSMWSPGSMASPGVEMVAEVCVVCEGVFF